MTEKEREYKRRWLAKNPEKRREVYLRYQRANREKIREYTRKWRRNNPEKARRLTRENHKKHRGLIAIYEARRNAERTALLNSIKLERGCSLCGYRQHAEALDFDHLNPAEKRIGISPAKKGNLARLMDEIARCRVLCANCHRVETANDPRIRQKRFSNRHRAPAEPATRSAPLFEGIGG